MKKLMALILTFSFIFSLMPLSSNAEEIFVFDEAGVLSEEEMSGIESSLKEIKRVWDTDIKVGIIPKKLGKELIFDAENFYGQKINNDSGILLLLDCQNEEAALFAKGKASEVFDEYKSIEISYSISSMMYDEDYSSLIYDFIATSVMRLSEDAILSGSLKEKDRIPQKRLIPRLIDNADLLSKKEENILLSKLDEISLSNKTDVALATVEFLDSRTAYDFCNDWFDYNGLGQGKNSDGVLFLVSMSDRDWAFSTFGRGETAFTEEGTDLLIGRMLDDLSDGYYFDSFMTYSSSCDEFLKAEETGKPYGKGNMPKEPLPFIFILFSIVIGIVSGFGGAFILKSQLTSVKMQERADVYTKKDSVKVPLRNEIFLYSTISRTAKPKNNSSSGGSSSGGMSSSGRSHGGSSGKF